MKLPVGLYNQNQTVPSLKFDNKVDIMIDRTGAVPISMEVYIMNIIIDQRLRELRDKRGNTQEDLANFLAVSSQAVSKWERGESIPDVALLPCIASYYNVSVDDLLGVGEIRKQEKIEEYTNKSMQLTNKGLLEDNLKLWREAYSEFPNELSVLYHLMYALSYIDGNEDEIISLGERILRESTDQHFRDGAIQMLCFTYHKKGDVEKAKEYAYMAGSLVTSRELLLRHVLQGDEQKEHCAQLLLSHLDDIGLTLINLCQNKDYARYAWLHEFYLKLADLFFDDGFHGFFACRAAERHHWLARIHVGDENRCRKHLLAAEKFAAQYDSLEGKYIYTSTLLNGLEGDMTCTSKNYTETQNGLLLSQIQDSHFDIVRDKEWFKSLYARLSEKEKKR